MKVTIIGCGRWGSFHAWYAAGIGHRVMLYGRSESLKRRNLMENRKNEYLELQPDVVITDDLQQAFEQVVIIAIGAQEFRLLCGDVRKHEISGKIFVLCMKGLEADSGKRLSQVFREEIIERVQLAVWLGPGHVQDLVNGIPNCMVIGSDNIETTRFLIEQFSSELIKFYIEQDLIGCEIGAAAKNVIGIAAGMLDGLGLTALKGALMARGTRELARLVRKMGGNELTVYGLSHLGDYEATLFSKYSHNRRYGEAFVNGDKFERLDEGVATIKALLMLYAKHDVELPICYALNSIIYESGEPHEVLHELLLPPLTSEF